MAKFIGALALGIVAVGCVESAPDAPSTLVVIRRTEACETRDGFSCFGLDAGTRLGVVDEPPVDGMTPIIHHHHSLGDTRLWVPAEDVQLRP